MLSINLVLSIQSFLNPWSRTKSTIVVKACWHLLWFCICLFLSFSVIFQHMEWLAMSIPEIKWEWSGLLKLTTFLGCKAHQCHIYLGYRTLACYHMHYSLAQVAVQLKLDADMHGHVLLPCYHHTSIRTCIEKRVQKVLTSHDTMDLFQITPLSRVANQWATGGNLGIRDMRVPSIKCIISLFGETWRGGTLGIADYSRLKP